MGGPASDTASSGPTPSLYPAHWEADVVLRDGGTAHLRPIHPDDADRLVSLFSRLSEQTVYFRFFAPLPALPPREVERFTHVDYRDRVALVATVGEQMLGVVRYDRIGPDEAEVAFVVEDAQQGRGFGSVFLEHIAAAARERGVRRFVADVLPANRPMINIFREAGYSLHEGFEEGVVHLTFSLEPTETSREVMAAREHRAEAQSMQRLLHPDSIAVVGASRDPRSVGQTVLRHLVGSGFAGEVYAVNPAASEVAGVPAYPSVFEVPGSVDLAVVAVPADAVEAVVADCARKQVRGLLVLSSGYAETGPEGRDRQRRLVALAHANGMRVIGPGSFGVVNTSPDHRFNATLAPVAPAPGRIGFLSQSGAMSVAVLHAVAQRGLGLSTFVSAGNRADVSGNDLLQYWEEDPATDTVLLYLESIGNPRKFSRIARRIARSKPVVVAKSGRAAQGVPLGHAVRASSAPRAAMDALFAQAGVIRVDSIHRLLDAGQLVARQPLPRGDRVGIVGNAASLGLIAADACDSWGLTLAADPVALHVEASPEEIRVALTRVFADPGVDSVVAVFVPPPRSPGEEVANVLAETAAATTKTVVSTFLGLREVGSSTGAGSVPSYPSPEDAVAALAAVTRYAEWRRRPPGAYRILTDLDLPAAQRIVEAAVGESAGAVQLDPARVAALLACYGIELWPAVPVADADEATAAASHLGYPVALKSTAPHLTHRSELGGVRLNLDTEAELRHAFEGMADVLGPGAAGSFVVQRMAPPGVPTVLTSTEDPLFGPVVSFGVGGVATDLLDDRAYRIPPLSDLDVAEMVRSLGAAPLLFGHRGAAPVDVPALEDLLVRVSRLADDVPEVATLELNPVVVAERGLVVLQASLRLQRPQVRKDGGPRALPG